MGMYLTIPVLEHVPILQAIIGIILVFFAPGFTWSLIMFKKLSRLERLVLSVGISIALVTLSVFGLNLAFHVPINALNSVFIILVITVIPLCIRYGIRYIENRRVKH